jgi:hypothetical protein
MDRLSAVDAAGKPVLVGPDLASVADPLFLLDEQSAVSAGMPAFGPEAFGQASAAYQDVSPMLFASHGASFLGVKP